MFPSKGALGEPLRVHSDERLLAGKGALETRAHNTERGPNLGGETEPMSDCAKCLHSKSDHEFSDEPNLCYAELDEKDFPEGCICSGYKEQP